MCLACIELNRLFNKAIARAQNGDDPAFEAKLKEKREWLLRDVFQQKCDVAKELLSKIKDDEISKDSSVLDGKTWDEILEENFTKREASPFPPPAKSQTPFIDQINELDKILEAINSTSDEEYQDYLYSPEDVETIKESEERQTDFWVPKHPFKVEPLKPTCSHEWMEYQGAGTRPPETICKTCGTKKS